jgi:hypothetical protein
VYEKRIWRAKHIESAILIAPAVSGSVGALGALSTHTLPFVAFLEEFDALEWLGGLDVLMPNLEILAKRVVYKGEKGGMDGEGDHRAPD